MDGKNDSQSLTSKTPHLPLNPTSKHTSREYRNDVEILTHDHNFEAGIKCFRSWMA